jgi:hypothetical protein
VERYYLSTEYCRSLPKGNMQLAKITKKFPKKDLIELLYGGKVDDLKLIQDEIVDNSRWSIIHSMVFEHSGVLYQTDYSVGATEQQNESAFEYDDDEIDCVVVKGVETVVIEYVPVEN